MLTRADRLLAHSRQAERFWSGVEGGIAGRWLRRLTNGGIRYWLEPSVFARIPRIDPDPELATESDLVEY